MSNANHPLPSALVRKLSMEIAPEEVGMLLVTTNRALNTWPEAPAPIWDLNAKCQAFIDAHPEYAYKP